MSIATRLQSVAVVAAALAFAITPLANPLLLALATFSAGLLLAHRCAVDLLASEDGVQTGDTVFRHYV